VVLKEQLVGSLNPLTNILYCLRSYGLPECLTLSEFGDMTLKFRAVQVLPPHSVVPFVKCNAMVIDHPGSINTALEVSIPLVLRELKLQCLHAIIVYHIDMQWQ
jgi:hypothetical protein